MVISDTTPIVVLDAIGLLDLMFHIFEEVTIPLAVDAELSAGLSIPGRREALARPWLKRVALQVPASPGQYGRDVDAGETEAIALFLEHDAELLLVDDGPARRTAKRFGIKHMGTAGILIAAKKQGLVSSVGDNLRELRDEHGFFLGNAAMRRILELAGEA